MELEGARVLVVGLGQSGLAAVELARARGALVEATDIRPLEKIPEAASRLPALGVAFSLQSEAVFENRDLIVISPGVPADLPPLEEARRRGVRVVGDLEMASWFLQGRTIGITGSNGKTTTTALTGHILAAAGIPVQVGANIGRAPASMVATSRPDQWNVLELSSFQLETIERFHADIAAVLNITPDHLDRHGTMERYAAAKRRLLETQAPEEPAILNAADPICREFGRLKASPVWFSSAERLARGVWVEDGWVVLEGRRLLEAREIPLPGRHNLENVMAAAAAAHLAGVSEEAIGAAVRSFPGVEHRLEFVRRVGSVDYYNDSKATNVDATLKALDAFAGPLWVILGGKDKGADFTALRAPLAQKARAALLIGAAAPKLAAELEGAVPVIHCGTLEAAVEEAARRAAPGDTVLLAPACASFDQFQNFEHRGRVFKALVARLEASRCA